MYFVIDSHVNSTKDDHTNRIHTLGVAHNIMMQHWRNDNGETRVNCNFEVRITDKCDNLGTRCMGGSASDGLLSVYSDGGNAMPMV